MKSEEWRCKGEHCSSRLQGVTRRAARLGEPCAGNPPVLELLGNSRDKEQAELHASPTPTMTAATPRALARCKTSPGKAPRGNSIQKWVQDSHHGIKPEVTGNFTPQKAALPKK